MILRPTLFALGLFFAAGAQADETPVNPQEVMSLLGFGSANPQCAQWTDGCAVCMHQSEQKQAVCSLPGIACQPHEIVCKAP